MSYKAIPFRPIPEQTARVAKAVFKRKANLYLTIGDQIGTLFDELDFAPLYAAEGKPAVSPNLLALVSVFQFLENLPDREAADAVRSRLDWKYALHLPLDYSGFDFSVLADFRQRLLQHDMAQQMFERVLLRLQALNLLRAGGKQRTDATYVLGATQALNLVQLAGETLRLALEALADSFPDWLRRIAQAHWYERYNHQLSTFRLPRNKDKQDDLTLAIAGDGFYLLSQLDQATAPKPAGQLPEVHVLAEVWAQQFEQHDDGPHRRAKADKPAGAAILTTPHDPQVRYSRHHSKEWLGYQVHWTETCTAEQPHLIVHVSTTSATRRDVEVIPEIHADLARLTLLPEEHFVDSAYVSGANLALSQQSYGVKLVGPIAANNNWQSRVPKGINLADFQIDWEQKSALCPQGQRSHRWRTVTASDGQTETQVVFPAAVCRACPVQAQCTRDAKKGRVLRLNPHHEAIQMARQRQETPAFRADYAQRAGIEGTVSEAVRRHGARQTRYIGQAKTHLQAVLTAIAINLERTASWLIGQRPATTRPAGLRCLAPAWFPVYCLPTVS